MVEQQTAPGPPAPGGRRTGGRALTRRRLVLMGVTAVVVVLLAVGALLRWVLPGSAGPLVVAGYLPVGASSAGALENAIDEGLTEVSPVWATVRPDGTLDATPFPAALREQLQRPGLRVLPTVQNYVDDAWDGQLVADLLDDPRRADAHREALVDAVLENGWDGIDLDYEALPPVAGEAFADFLAALADDLHGHDRLLSLAVPARTSDEDSWTLAYSYQRLGEIADQVRVMAYDHAWSGSLPGPVAPLPWVAEVLTYALERIPAEKLVLGLATYGYDWVGSEGVYLPATAVFELANGTNSVPRWDPTAAASTFDYAVDGERHTVWYEDARSLEAKLDLAEQEGLRGVAVWQIGGEDPGIWGVLSDSAGD